MGDSMSRYSDGREQPRQEQHAPPRLTASDRTCWSRGVQTSFPPWDQQAAPSAAEATSAVATPPSQPPTEQAKAPPPPRPGQRTATALPSPPHPLAELDLLPTELPDLLLPELLPQEHTAEYFWTGTLDTPRSQADSWHSADHLFWMLTPLAIHDIHTSR